MTVGSERDEIRAEYNQFNVQIIEDEDGPPAIKKKEEKMEWYTRFDCH